MPTFWNLNVRSQLGIIFMTCAIISGLTFYVYNTNNLRDIFSKEFEARTLQTTETVKIGIEIGLANENLDSIKTIFDWVKKTDGFGWIAIVDPTGNLVASYPDSINFSYTDVEQRIQNQTLGDLDFIRFAEWTSPLLSGKVYISFSTSDLRQQEKHVLIDSIIQGIALVIAFGLIVLILQKSIVYPIEKLRNITSEIALGKTTERASMIDKSNQEIKSLTNSFNKMMDELETEKNRSERLLLNILPQKIAERLKKGEEVIADQHDNVSIIFTDIVGFTQLTERTAPHELVEILNIVFRRFDEILEQHLGEKIKTIGDAYLAVIGLLHKDKNPSLTSVKVAQKMLLAIQDINKELGLNLNVRIGIHTGSAIAGVIGKKKFAFDLWGDAVNIASRLESHGEPGRIHVSKTVVDEVSTNHNFIARGPILLKNKGQLETFFVGE